jgi:hypothetical protein
MCDTPRIILDLIGGSEDGIQYESPIANGYYWQAHHGRVGARFRMIPEARLLDQIVVRNQHEFERSHYEIYEIQERRDDWDHIYIRARYIGREHTTAIDPDE